MSTPHHDDAIRIKKNRDVLLERFRGEILREAGNRNSLNQVKARIFHDSHVNADPVLADSLRAFIAQRESLLAHAIPKPTQQRVEKLPPRTPVDTLADVQRKFHELAVEFDHVVADGNEVVARDLMNQMRVLAEAHPTIISPETLHHFATSIAELAAKQRAFNERISALARKAEAAAIAGDDETTARILKRLYGIHATFPASLPSDRLRSIKQGIIKASERFDHRHAIEELSRRAHAVAAEIKTLAAAIHRFHVASRTVAHDSDTYKQAEEEYRRLVQNVRSHDADWFAALVLELVEFLAEWDHPPARARHQVDLFLDFIRSALVHLRAEIHEIDSERGDALQTPIKK
jgi:hypothetical protein